MYDRVRDDIDKFAKNAFAVSLEAKSEERAEKLKRTMAEVQRRGNLGGYLPALIELGAETLREDILALCDKYVEAIDLFGMPAGVLSLKFAE
jgi:hypothetical protein